MITKLEVYHDKSSSSICGRIEEIEALSPVDVFRRAGFDCSMLGLESASVTGSHGIQVTMDGVFDGNLDEYDLVVLPGGMPGSTKLRDHQA
mgnify:CR=1 FL=1